MLIEPSAEWRGTDGRPMSPRDVGAIVKRSAELRAFVRCDEKIDDPQQQTVNDYLCK